MAIAAWVSDRLFEEFGGGKPSMNVRSVLFVSGLVAAAIWVPGVCLGASLASPTPVEVWTGGDDGLTQRLTDAISTTFEHSPEFAMSAGQKPGTLYVSIVTHVTWEQVGPRTRITAPIEITYSPPNAKPVHDLHGSSAIRLTCWEDDLSGCAKTVTEFALNARTSQQKSN